MKDQATKIPLAPTPTPSRLRSHVHAGGDKWVCIVKTDDDTGAITSTVCTKGV